MTNPTIPSAGGPPVPATEAPPTPQEMERRMAETEKFGDLGRSLKSSLTQQLAQMAAFISFSFT